ncbi:GMC family oxidoreductase [Burkholderia pseudomultivorans]|uniref:GMC family oxidoreductase n=1 Tax=Burkholderia pseudomultivorans TaxID=1207504 RepID=UPI0007C7CD2C|nr:GMC family oxidoreductase N-terminal domain-containing protein [Burkholderia pseudomultivorans]
MRSNSYDFIVVGSGSAGGVLAARLSEGGKYAVLCLEAGKKGARYIWTRPPMGVAFMINNPVVNWRYQSEPGESHGNRSLYVPRGKVLGGSSAINGLVYNRGQREDYDGWAAEGCQGWSFSDVLPLFKKIESTEIGSDEYRGRRGPVKVIEASKSCPFFDVYMAAAASVGIRNNPDYSGASQEGVAMSQQTGWRGLRHSTATQYLEPARKRPNLTILQGAEATKLILEGKRCVGVRFRRNGQMEEARAAREVIVCGGTINSPKLLELSGIGNPDILRRHGIPIVHALPGVGENLREHYAGLMKWRLNRPGIALTRKARGWRLMVEVLRYVLFRTGFVAQGYGSLRLFARTRPELTRPDFMMVVNPYILEVKSGNRRQISATEGFFAYTHPQRTESTGSIHIRSADPFDPPAIRFNFLDTEEDCRTAILSVRRAREIAAASPLRELVAEELAPGPAVQSDADILQYLRNTGQMTQHPVGTCKMGCDEWAVVDERLRVRGIDGLRIADASIMPTLISGNTSVPCMMIGEKCAEMVIEDTESRAAVSRADEPERRRDFVESGNGLA